MIRPFVVQIGILCEGIYQRRRGWGAVKYGMGPMGSWKHTPVLRNLNCFLGLSFHSGSVKALLFQISQWIQNLLNYRPVWNLHDIVSTEKCIVSYTAKFYTHSWGFCRNWWCNSMDYCRVPMFCSQWLCYCRIGLLCFYKIRDVGLFTFLSTEVHNHRTCLQSTIEHLLPLHPQVMNFIMVALKKNSSVEIKGCSVSLWVFSPRIGKMGIWIITGARCSKCGLSAQAFHPKSLVQELLACHVSLPVRRHKHCVALEHFSTCRYWRGTNQACDNRGNAMHDLFPAGGESGSAGMVLCSPVCCFLSPSTPAQLFIAFGMYLVVFAILWILMWGMCRIRRICHIRTHWVLSVWLQERPVGSHGKTAVWNSPSSKG